MTYCSKLFNKLEKLIEEKKNLTEIGTELCDTVAYPREKAIRLVKAHYGDSWLTENAKWLGYETAKIRDINEQLKLSNEQLKLSIENVQITEPKPKIINEKSVFGFINDKRIVDVLQKTRTDKENGIWILGKLEEGYGDMIHWCHIKPYIEEGFYLVKITTFTHIEDEDLGEDYKMHIDHMIYAVKTDCVGPWIDMAMQPLKWHRAMKEFMQDTIGTVPFPKMSKFQKSKHPDWEWGVAITRRLNIKEWLSEICEYGGFEWLLWDNKFEWINEKEVKDDASRGHD